MKWDKQGCTMNRQVYIINIQVYTMYRPSTDMYVQNKHRNSWYISHIYSYILFFHTFSCTYLFRTCLCNVYTRYIHEMYKFICLCTDPRKAKRDVWVGFEPRTSCIASSRLNHFASSVHINDILVKVSSGGKPV